MLTDFAKNGTHGHQMDQIMGKTKCSANNSNFSFFKWPSGQSPDTFSLDVICSATIQVWRTTNDVTVGPMCGLNSYCKTSELT